MITVCFKLTKTVGEKIHLISNSLFHHPLADFWWIIPSNACSENYSYTSYLVVNENWLGD